MAKTLKVVSGKVKSKQSALKIKTAQQILDTQGFEDRDLRIRAMSNAACVSPQVGKIDLHLQAIEKGCALFDEKTKEMLYHDAQPGQQKQLKFDAAGAIAMADKKAEYLETEFEIEIIPFSTKRGSEVQNAEVLRFEETCIRLGLEFLIDNDE